MICGHYIDPLNSKRTLVSYAWYGGSFVSVVLKSDGELFNSELGAEVGGCKVDCPRRVTDMFQV